MSKALYVAQVYECPEETRDRMNSAILRFVWVGKRGRTDQGVTFQKEEQGGLNLPHSGLFFDSVLQTNNLRILNGNPGPEKKNVAVLVILSTTDMYQKESTMEMQHLKQY